MEGVDAGHADIENDHIGGMGMGKLDGLRAIGRSGDDLDVAR
jgi:hypothetical protein